MNDSAGKGASPSVWQVPKDTKLPESFSDTLLKNASVAVVLFSVTLYVAGEAAYRKTSQLLGLSLLVQPSKEQFLFTGFQALFVYLFVGALLLICAWLTLESWMPKYSQVWRLSWKPSALAVVFCEWAALVVARQFLTDGEDRLTLAQTALPQLPFSGLRITWMGILSSFGLWVAIIATPYVYSLMPRSIWRFWFLYVCLIAFIGNLLELGKAEGVASVLNERYNIVEIAGTSAIRSDAKVLVLQSDDKSLVVLTASSPPGRHSVLYITRSDIKSIALTGTTSINSFLTYDLACSNAPKSFRSLPQSASPKRH